MPSGTWLGTARGLDDLDADGMQDLIVLSSGYANVISTKSGKLLNRHGLSNSPIATVDRIADTNGDGVDDYLIGSTAQFGKGDVALYSGATGAHILTIPGQAGDQFGGTLAGAGDLDGDGKGDIVVGAKTAVEPSNNIVDAGFVAAYSSATGKQLWIVYGQVTTDLMGESLARLGDVNADGFDDIVCCSRSEVRVVDGVTGSTLSSVTAASLGQTHFASAAEGLSSLGDVNDDSIPDFAMGVSTSSGRVVWVRSGKDCSLIRTHSENSGVIGSGFGRNVAGVGDVDGDGVGDLLTGDSGQRKSDIFVYSGASGKTIWSISNQSLSGGSLAASVSFIGDLTGDGHNEIMFTENPPSTGSKTRAVHIFDLRHRNYVGTEEDLFLTSSVAARGLTFQDRKSARGGDLLEVHFESPTGAFTGDIPILIADAFASSVGAGSLPGFPSVHVNANSFAILYTGLGAPFGPQVLPSTGMSFAFRLPLGLNGNSLILQTLVLSTKAKNGFFAASDAHEIMIR